MQFRAVFFRGLVLASFLVFLSVLSVVASANEGVATVGDVLVERDRPRFNDQIAHDPSKIRLERPNLDAELRETVGKLPLLTSGSRSGFGSASSVITATGLSSAATAVSIDGVPIVDPNGVGFNFSLVPSALVESVEYWLPHHQALDPASQTLASTSGRMNLRTKASRRLRNRFGSTFTVGSYQSILGSAVYERVTNSDSAAFAITGHNTKGDYEYKNDRNGSRERRANNSSAGGGALARWSRVFDRDGASGVDVFGLASGNARTNPGSLEAPGRDRQEDLFSVIGASARNPEFFNKSSGASVALAGSLSKVAIKNPPLYENRTFGGFAKVAVEKRLRGATGKGADLHFAVDDHVDYVRADSGRLNRNILGLAAAVPVHLTSEITFAPWVRQELANRMPSTRDAIAAMTWSLGRDNHFTASYGYLHAYPTITQIAGEHTPFGEVLPNNSLKLERSGVWTAMFTHESERVQFLSLVQHARIRNRISFESVFNGTSFRSQYVNAADAFVTAWSNDLQWNVVSFIGLRAAGTVSRSFDFQTRRDLAYKPRVIGLGSVVCDLGAFARALTLLPKARSGFLFLSLEESVWGKRWTGRTGVDTISPIAQTHVRLALQSGPLEMAVRAANIFEESGFDHPGYPIAGRSYWFTTSLAL